MASDKLSFASITDRLALLGHARWEVHFAARRRVAAGEDIIELTIGEPDVPTPVELIDVANDSMRAGRTGYAGGKGERVLLEAVAAKYTARTGREISPDQVLAFPYGPGGDTTWPVKLWRDSYDCGAGNGEGPWNARDFLTFERTTWTCPGGDISLDIHPGGHFIPHGWIARQLDEMLGLPPSYP